MLTVISALRDVMRDARKYDATVPWHKREAMANQGHPLAALMRKYVKNEGEMKVRVPFANMKVRVPFVTANGVTFGPPGIP
jgi:hypothetical protein